MTYEEALHKGYRLGDRMYTIGYLSRTIDVMSQPVKVAGGSRKGQLYVDVPAYQTSRYHMRQYLVNAE